MNKFMLSIVATSTVLLAACGGGGSGQVDSVNLPTTLPSKKPSIQADEKDKNDALGLQIEQAKYIDAGLLQEKAKVELNALAKDLETNFKSLDEYTVYINNRRYPNAEGIRLGELGNGFKDLNVREVAKVTTKHGKYTVNREGKLYLYQQDYSLIANIMPAQVTISGMNDKIQDSSDAEVFVRGVPTVSLPESGRAVYVGQAFAEYDGKLKSGDLNYVVDFLTKTGSGYISSDVTNIELQKAKIVETSHTNELDRETISAYGIEGRATSTLGDGSYKLGFFGPKAEEIVGSVDIGDTTISFGGAQ